MAGGWIGCHLPLRPGRYGPGSLVRVKRSGWRPAAIWRCHKHRYGDSHHGRHPDKRTYRHPAADGYRHRDGRSHGYHYPITGGDCTGNDYADRRAANPHSGGDLDSDGDSHQPAHPRLTYANPAPGDPTASRDADQSATANTNAAAADRPTATTDAHSGAVYAYADPLRQF